VYLQVQQARPLLYCFVALRLHHKLEAFSGLACGIESSHLPHLVLAIPIRCCTLPSPSFIPTRSPHSRPIRANLGSCFSMFLWCVYLSIEQYRHPAKSPTIQIPVWKVLVPIHHPPPKGQGARERIDIAPSASSYTPIPRVISTLSSVDDPYPPTSGGITACQECCRV